MNTYFCSGSTEIATAPTHYIPSIEDIFVGYEAEFNWATINKCAWIIFDKDTFENAGDLYEPLELWETIECGYNKTIFDSKHTPEEFYNLLKLDRIRTPYLNYKQIEAQGWEPWKGTETTTPFDLLMFWGSRRFERDGYILIHEFRNHTVTIYEKKDKAMEDYPGNWNTIFKGRVPSINEFRKIMKFLNVK